MVLGFALQMSRNIYRDMKRSKSENESRYLYGMKVDLWKEPLSSEELAKLGVSVNEEKTLADPMKGESFFRIAMPGENDQ
jgi:hypothetical protein